MLGELCGEYVKMMLGQRRALGAKGSGRNEIHELVCLKPPTCFRYLSRSRRSFHCSFPVCLQKLLLCIVSLHHASPHLIFLELRASKDSIKSCIIIKRFRVTLTASGKREFVQRDQIFPISLYVLFISSAQKLVVSC